MKISIVLQLLSFKSINHSICAVLFMLFASITTSAQVECQDNILKVADLYDQGQFDEGITLAKSCLNSESAWQAHRLIAMCYLEKKQSDLAKEHVLNLIELRPTYKIDLLHDPRDLVKLIENVNVIPAFSIGLNANYGGNLTMPRVLGTFNPAEFEKNYNSKTSFQFGFNLGYNFNSRHGLDLGLNARSKKYEIDYNALGSDVVIDERMMSLDFPVTYNYTINPDSRFRLGLFGGPYGSLLINSYNDLKISNEEGSKELPHYNSQVRRKLFNYGLTGGLSGIYKLNASHVSLRVSYSRGLNNLTEVDQRYQNSRLIYDYFYLDDDLALDFLSFSIGYHRYINYKIER